jgi:acetyl esterase/lipase
MICRFSTPVLLALTVCCIPEGRAQDKPTAVGKAAERKPPAGIRYFPDLVYRKPGKDILMLDLACPRVGKGPLPGVILLHGAGPTDRGRKDLEKMAWLLAEKGYVVAAVNYRNQKNVAFPGPLEDAACAVRWLRVNARNYGIDPDRIAVVGYSAGGCLASLLALTGPKDGLDGGKEHPGVSSRVQAVVSYSAPCDLARLHTDCAECSKRKGSSLPDVIASTFIRKALEDWMGGPPAKFPDGYAKVSPITYARRGAPPALLIHGCADHIVPADHSRRLAERLEAVGGTVGLLLVGKAGHDLFERDDPSARLAAAAVLAFLDEHLRRGRPGK